MFAGIDTRHAPDLPQTCTRHAPAAPDMHQTSPSAPDILSSTQHAPATPLQTHNLEQQLQSAFTQCTASVQEQATSVGHPQLKSGGDRERVYLCCSGGVLHLMLVQHHACFVSHRMSSLHNQRPPLSPITQRACAPIVIEQFISKYRQPR